MIYTLKTIYDLGIDKYKDMPIMALVSYISISGDLVEHVVANIEPLFSKRQEEQMYRLFEEINTIFETKLKHIVDFDALRKEQNYTIGFFALSALQAFGLSFFTCPKGALNASIYLLFRTVTIIIIRVRRFQSCIIINLLSNILKDMQRLLKQSQENYVENSNRNMTKNIVYLRDIYSKAWLIKKSISCCFGFSFITFLMDYCFDFINSSYWAYVTINRYETKIRIMRKIYHLFSYSIEN